MCIFVHVANLVQRMRLIRFSEMPQRKWTKESSQRHWQQHPSHLILQSTNLRQLNETLAARRSERLRKKATRKEEFLYCFRVPRQSKSRDAYLQKLPRTWSFGPNMEAGPTVAVVGSWNQKKFCLPSGNWRSQPVQDHVCVQVAATRSHTWEGFHLLSKILPWTKSTLFVLSAHFQADTRTWCSAIELRKEPFKIKWAQKDVDVKIRNIQDPVSTRRTKAVFDYLMSKSNCSYRKFIEMHRSHVREPWIFELFSHPAFHEVETALWPHLYHKNALCKSFLKGQESRESLMSKITSAIADYAIHYDLLHYHYDCWLFNTITGAINSGIKAQCSPTTSFDAKTFSHQYWANQHRYLINPVRQFGSPLYSSPSRRLRGPFHSHRGWTTYVTRRAKGQPNWLSRRPSTSLMFWSNTFEDIYAAATLTAGKTTCL